MGDASAWITSPEVRKALHLDGVEPGASTFTYTRSGPASITLYPELVQKLNILIYSGDADACLPFNGNEEWILAFEEQGILQERAPWKPWFANVENAPAGYITRYEVPGKPVLFDFVTVRLAGHMVPQYQPDAALAMIEKFFTEASAVPMPQSSASRTKDEIFEVLYA